MHTPLIHTTTAGTAGDVAQRVWAALQSSSAQGAAIVWVAVITRWR